jgi:uncharacterized protein YcfL
MNYAKYTFIFILLLVLQACQSSDENQPTKKSNSMIIDESNYVKISKYNYMRFSIMKNRHHVPAGGKYRSYPGTTDSVQNKKDLLQISAGTSENENENIMLIKQNNTNVSVTVNMQNDSVTISYDDGEKTLKKDMTFEEFQNQEEGGMS